MATIITELGNLLPLTLVNGGTNNIGLTATIGGILYSNASQAVVSAGTATANQALVSGSSTTPAWTTDTYPASTTLGQLMYSSSANVISALTVANGGVLVTSSSGVPSEVALGLSQNIIGRASATPGIATTPGINRLLNGDFQICQRGAGGSASFAMSGIYMQGPDRWQVIGGGSGACTMTQTAGATSGSYLLQCQRANGNASTQTILIGQTLTRDMAIGAAGKVLTISFKALIGANFSGVSNALSCYVVTGTGNTDVSYLTTGFTAPVNVVNNVYTVLNSTLTNYALQSTTLASNVSQIAILFQYTPTGTAGAADYFQITDIQLEVSPNQTSYQRRSFESELKECQRFYYKTFAYGTAPAQNLGVGTSEATWLQSTGASLSNFSQSLIWPVPMIAAPTVTLYSPAAATAQAYNETQGTACTSTTAYRLTANNTVIQATQAALTNFGQLWGVHMTADAELV
jgi:hypothetical protein